MSEKKYKSHINLILVRYHMKIQGISQVKMAELIGITSHYFWEVLNGRRRLSKAKCRLVADVLKVPYSELQKEPSQKWIQECWMALLGFSEKLPELDWKRAQGLARDLGAYRQEVDDSGVSEGQREDAELLEEGVVPEAYKDE